MDPINIDVGNAILRRAMRRERVFRDRQDPLALPHREMVERYRFSREGILQILGLVGATLEHPTRRSHSLPAILQLCVALRFFATGTFLYVVGDCSLISKATVCRIVRRVGHAINNLMNLFIRFPGFKHVDAIKRQFYDIASKF